MEEDRIAIIKEWHMPKYHRNIQVFLGFANIYRPFIKGFSRIVRLSTAMLKEGWEGKIFGPFEPTPEMKKAFWRLQGEFTTAPVLVHFNYERPICLETNASGFAIAGIISQPLPFRQPQEKKDEKLRTATCTRSPIGHVPCRMLSETTW